MTNECATALVEVLRSLEFIPKDASLDTGRRGYTHDYRSKESIFDAIRGPLAAAGVFAALKVREVQPGPKDSVIVLVDVTFHHGASGSTVECGGVGQGADSNDKAVAKALTSAIRSFYDNLWMWGLERDAETYASDRPTSARSTSSAPRTNGAAKPFDRAAVVTWALRELDKICDHEDEAAAYLDGHWLPNVARVSDIDKASDADVRTFAAWLRDTDSAVVAARVEERLTEIGFFGEPAGAPDPGAY